MLILFFGVSFLFFGRHVQTLALKMVDVGFGRCIPGVRAFVSATSYLFFIRGSGLVMLALFALLVWVAFRTR